MESRKLRIAEIAYAAACAVALLWINVYVCRELFFHVTGHMNSMQGFWTGLARLGGDSWWHATWWPYWDCGIPFEFTYAPLVPLLTALCAALRGVPHALAMQSISGLAYCLVPLTLFLMAWLLTRAPGYSFLAALLYSLTAPAELLAPDGAFSISNFWSARRLMLVSVWDETPHVLALAFLPLAILFLSLSITRRRPVYYMAAVVTISGAALTSAFGPTMVAMATVCLLFVLGDEGWRRRLSIVALIAGLSYAICAPFLSPALLRAMQMGGQARETTWNMGSVTALALVIIGWILLWPWLRRSTKDWRVQFFALFAYLTSMIPILAKFLHRQFLPQPDRYKLEMEMALSLAIVFGLKGWIEKASRPLKAALLLLVVGLAGEQIVSYRQFAKAVLRSADLTRTIEYRTAAWVDQNLDGTRVMLPGSIAQWANAFTNIQQLSGSSWSMPYNPVQQRAVKAIYNGGSTPEQDARVSLAWLEAYGAGAIAVSGPHSDEFWKPFAHPAKFEGRLPVLWREGDVTIYQVPQRSSSLAHVLGESAILTSIPSLETLERYAAALNDPTLPPARFQWDGRNRIHIRSMASPEQVISIQVSYNSGWRAKVNGQAANLRRDALGLMWLQPECHGACNVDLEYRGSWELRLCRYVSILGLFALCGLPLALRRR
jgi:hypothetical protein